MMRLVFLLSLTCCFWATAAGQEGKNPLVIMSENYRYHKVSPPTENNTSKLQVFCFHGLPKRFFRLWHSSFLNLSAIPTDLEVFSGQNETEVRTKFSEAQQSFLPFWWSVAMWKKGSIPIAPFQFSCVGISSSEGYSLELSWKIEYVRILIFACSLVLFFKAKRLSQHIALYYSVGISISLVASIVLAVLILHRFIPFRRGFYFLMLISSTTSIAILEYVLRNFEFLFVERQTLLVTYIAMVSCVSFCVLYYFAPKIMNPRCYNLVQWGLQAASLACIFFSSQIPEVACAFILLMLTVHNFPLAIVYRARGYWYRWFPKPRKFLSEEEYHDVVQETTRKALEDLREYCRSPQCKSWKIVSRLKSPTRFASFVEGEHHLNDAEEELFEASNFGSSASHLEGDGDSSMQPLNESDESIDYFLPVLRG